ncbi:DUF1552 domain-containing protein [Anatilimnocola aggregata]|nr:DUF1552 domain-containing protein [Anatilimnocola aggregata]
MLPRLLANDQTAKANVPRPRLLFIDEIGNGVDNVRWYPTKLGREWEITETLRPLEPFRDHMTVLSGLRQTYDDNGHLAADTFLTGAKATSNAVSVDQVAAEHLGKDVQFPSLVLGPGGTGTVKWSSTLSYDRKGRPIPSISDAGALFQKLFVAPTDAAVRETEARISRNESILDGLEAQTVALRKSISAEDARQVDAYLDAVREMERQIARDRSWLQKAPPDVDKAAFAAAEKQGRQPPMYELMRMALLTERSRVGTLMFTSGLGSAHGATHHKGQQSNLDVVAARDLKAVKLFASFVASMQATPVGDGTLLDYTCILFGSHMNNGTGWAQGFPFKSTFDSHSVRNLPILLVGGRKLGVKQGQHLLFPDEKTTLSRLFVEMLKCGGIPAPRFNGQEQGISELS